MNKQFGKSQFKKGQQFGKWTLESYLGGGGNGEVWKCLDEKANLGAIKLLKSVNNKSYARFIDEITIIEKNSDIEGLIPVLDKYLPADVRGVMPFFVMPVADGAEEHLQGKSIEVKIDAILQIGETLKQLHQRGISHRDLKPANLLFYNSRFSISDFGLVDYPDKKDISFINEVIGAKWTMAPEMRRYSSKADGLKADVYSLAKTLWIILTENPKGFDGQYTRQSVLGLGNYFQSSYTIPIDNLLSSCTDNDPDARPSVTEFISILENWKSLNNDFHERNLEQWFEVQKRLFPTSFPKRVIWESVDDIVSVLKVICSFSNLNHMFFPSGGGLDLEDAKISHEEGCIELDFQSVSIVKPKRLLFESFGSDPAWNYFRLELDELEPYSVKYNDEDEVDNDYELEEGADLEDGRELEDGDESYTKKDRGREEVSELNPGQYDRYELVANRYDYRDMGYEIPAHARIVTRWFRGSFVIFNKRSPYNLDSSTYDARHNKVSTDEFRDYIQSNL